MATKRKIGILALVALLGAAAGRAAPVTLEPVDSVRADVLVVGAGSAGVPAAVQAGRLGAKTVLVEAAPVLGGNLTLGGIGHPDAFIKNDHVAVSGIGLEWTTNAIALGKGPSLAPKDRTGRPLIKKGFDRFTFICVGEEMLEKAGVDLRYYESPIRIARTGDGKDALWRVHTAAQGELREILCKQIVDCTGNGTVAKMCGAEFLPVDGEWQGASFDYGLTGMPDVKKLPEGLFKARWEAAVADGSIRDGDTHGGDVGPEQICRWTAHNYVYGADSSTARTRTRANVEARKSAMRVLRFNRSLPGGEKARFAWMSPEVGIRETNRVKGRHVLTGEEYMAGKIWDDSICYSVYHIDMHMHRWKDFIRKIPGKRVYSTVPFRSLLPEKVENLLVAGRCLSADREAFAATRLCAVAMATGQAAGAAAALAAQKGVAPSELDIGELKAVLEREGQIVPRPGLFPPVKR